ncbi:MAG: translation initiation factor IF-2 subunit gamma [Candidatus Aenigmarchaeota archaeon]|nr:translation initiation factor IF-2 subunit gamma [Candidatus Aenigmarchaeota archaeon]
MVGHVDHGKTSLTQSLTGAWTDTHSEEVKRGITIRLGYADSSFYYCERCDKYSLKEKCIACFTDTKYTRTISLVDAPGHETLMATVLSGTALMDGAILVVAANEKCPQPQTAEHLKALDIAGIKNIVIVQNKIDLVDEEQAMRNYNEIKSFTKGTVAENSPIIPVSAAHNINIDLLIGSLEKFITTPKRDLTKEVRFYVARSFDVNKPGTSIDDLKGGVVGGSITQGIVKKGDELIVVPGVKDEKTNTYKPLKSKIVGIIQGGKHRDEGHPGGLVALQTELDPSISKGDKLSGNILGVEGKLPELSYSIKFKINLFDYIIGIKSGEKLGGIKTGDVLMVTATIAKTVGVVASSNNKVGEMKLKIPLAVVKDEKIALSKQIGGRWHLIGWGVIA